MLTFLPFYVRLTEEMINDPTDEGALAVQDLTFARLCPLLILLVRHHAY